jgi:hypothetical protein
VKSRREGASEDVGLRGGSQSIIISIYRSSYRFPSPFSNLPPPIAFLVFPGYMVVIPKIVYRYRVMIVLISISALSHLFLTRL